VRSVPSRAALQLDQVAQRHVAAGALGDLHLLAAAHHRDHLVQHVVRVALRDADAQRLQAGAHARDVPWWSEPCTLIAFSKPRCHLVTW
jgi:hypothetical protein